MRACISRRRNVLQSSSGFISVKLPHVQHFLLHYYGNHSIENCYQRLSRRGENGNKERFLIFLVKIRPRYLIADIFQR